MDEREAISRCLAGDQEAFAVLVRQYQTLIVGICLRLTGSREDAADVAQQAFVNAYRHLQQFDPGQPFRPWLCRIATNECIAFLRRNKRQAPPTPDEDLAAVSDPAAGAPALVDLAEDRQRVRQAVAELPEQYRTVVVLYYFQELSYQEIVRQTGLSVGTISTQLHRAKQLLRRRLADEASEKSPQEEVGAGEAHRARTAASVPKR